MLRLKPHAATAPPAGARTRREAERARGRLLAAEGRGAGPFGPAPGRLRLPKSRPLALSASLQPGLLH